MNSTGNFLLLRLKLSVRIGLLDWLATFPPFVALFRVIQVVAVLGVGVSSLFVAVTQDNRTVVPFHSIEWSFDAPGYDKPTNLVINDQNTWSNVWKQAFCAYDCPRPVAPNVNFTQRTVLAVFLGHSPSSGYWINVTQVTRAASSVTVTLLVTNPGPNCIEYFWVTYPYHFVDIEKTTSAVTFNSQTVVENCISNRLVVEFRDNVDLNAQYLSSKYNLPIVARDYDGRFIVLQVAPDGAYLDPSFRASILAQIRQEPIVLSAHYDYY